MRPHGIASRPRASQLCRPLVAGCRMNGDSCTAPSLSPRVLWCCADEDDTVVFSQPAKKASRSRSGSSSSSSQRSAHKRSATKSHTGRSRTPAAAAESAGSEDVTVRIGSKMPAPAAGALPKPSAKGKSSSKSRGNGPPALPPSPVRFSQFCSTSARGACSSFAVI